MDELDICSTIASIVPYHKRVYTESNDSFVVGIGLLFLKSCIRLWCNARVLCFKQMRLRPVFILSEGFCRAHGLPHKRILRPPLFKKAPEVVNYSKLAIRYTSSMTKDMVYGALREVFRGVRDREGSKFAPGLRTQCLFINYERFFHLDFRDSSISH